MRTPRTTFSSDPERSEALLAKFLLRLAPRGNRAFRMPALGEVPQPQAGLSADDGDLAPAFQDLEHQRDVTASEPAALATGFDRAILEIASQKRAAPRDLAQAVAAEGRA